MGIFGYLHLNWVEVTIEKLADFIHWLRGPESKVTSIQVQESNVNQSSGLSRRGKVSGFQHREGTFC